MAPVGGLAAAATGAEAMNIRVTGNLDIRFDEKMFKVKLRTWVAELMSTPEVRTASARAGNVNVND